MSPSVMKTLNMNLARRARTSYATPTVKGAANVANMIMNTFFTAPKRMQFSQV